MLYDPYHVPKGTTTMTDKNLEAIKDRLRKLLNVAKEGSNATEGEMNNAMQMATRLMSKHHLDVSDLKGDPRPSIEDMKTHARNAEKGRYWATVGGKFFAWETSLAKFVADFVGVKVYCDGLKRDARLTSGLARANADGEFYKGKSFVFYGVAEDAMSAANLFYELWPTTWYAGMMKFGKAYSGDGGKYCQGFVVGMRTAFNATNASINLENSSERGLMVVNGRKEIITLKKSLADDYLRNAVGIKLRSGGSRSGANGSTGAYNEGKADGAKQNVRRATSKKLT